MKNGKIHREADKPAVIIGRFREWWVDGKLHREGDLPAVIIGRLKEWWVKGILVRLVNE